MAEVKPPRQVPKVVPKIVIDARMVKEIPHGFGAYVTRLAEGLELMSEEGELLYEPVFLVAPDSPKKNFRSFGTVTVSAPFLNPGELVQLPRVVNALQASAFHSPTFCSLFTRGPWRLACPWAVTIHDLNHLTWGGLRDRIYYERLLKTFARKAKALLTVSEFSRGELDAWLGGRSPEIELAPNAIAEGFLEPLPYEVMMGVLERYGLEAGNYFVCISNPKPHKNVAMLVEAYSQARSRSSQDFWPLATTVAGFSRAGVKPLHEVRELEARALIRNAGAVVFPSLYEGFGLPPVEAVCLGAPLLVSSIAPHREGLRDLADDEAVWIDPRDAAGWADALARAARGAPPRAREATRERVASRYSVRSLGQKMDQIYRRMLGFPS